MDDAGERLASSRQRTLARLATLTRDFDGVVEASRDSNADDEHDPEGATIAFERSQVEALVQQAQRHLTDLDRAESRLAAGSYGTCETCGGPIGSERLAARPTATRCITCASRV